MKKLIALLALLALCFSLFSCSNDGAPDGMKSATLEGEPFILYVPESWTDNTSSGISGAFVGKMNITARYREADEGVSLSDYVSSVTNAYAASLDAFQLKESASAVLGGADAMIIRYTAEYNGAPYCFAEYVTIHKGDAIHLKFTSPKDLYEQNAAAFDEVASVFVLRDKPEVKNDELVDEKTPDGMKIASSDNVEYVLYVPKSWICSFASGANAAYVDESGKPNFSVTSYSPDKEMTPAEYFEFAEKSYAENLSGYTRVSESDTKIHGIAAKSYVYTVNYGGIEYKIMQTVTVYGGRIYSLTYTAPSDRFDAHIEEVNAILGSFIFR